MRYAYWRDEGQASPSRNPEDAIQTPDESAEAPQGAGRSKLWPIAGVGIAGALTVAAAIAVGLPDRAADEATAAPVAQADLASAPQAAFSAAEEAPVAAASPSDEEDAAETVAAAPSDEEELVEAKATAEVDRPQTARIAEAAEEAEAIVREAKAAPETDAAPAADTVSELDAAPAAEAEAGADNLELRMAGLTEAPTSARDPAETDPQETASIEADASSMENGVAVADSEAEILALEDAQREQNAELLYEVRGTQLAYSSAVIPDVADAEPIGEASTAVLQPAQVTEYVNFRAGPANEEAVIAVIPEGTTIEAATDCVHWCEAVYQGQRGYIYKTFVTPLDTAAAASVEATAAQP